MVNLFYTTIAGDPELQTNFPGLQIRRNMNRRWLATTLAGGPGDCFIVISKSRAGKFEWNAGGLAGQQQHTVRIDIAAKALEATVAESTGSNPPITALDKTEAIKRRIEDLLFPVTYNGTGWISHTELDDGYPSAPMERMAYDRLIYICWVTMG